MDRHFLVGLAMGLVVALGCNRGGPPSGDTQPGDTTAGSAASDESSNGDTHQPGKAATAAHMHRPIIIGSELTDPRESLGPLTTSSPAIESLPLAHPSAVESTPLFPSPLDTAFNPLREESEAAMLAPRPENPLRTFDRDAPVAAAAAAPRPLAAATDRPSAGGGAGWEAEAAAALRREEARAMEERREAEMALGARAAKAAAPSPPELSHVYDVVQVFYGTDRQSSQPRAEAWVAKVVRFLPAGSSLLVTLCLALAAASRRHLALWLIVFGGVGVSLGLGYQAAATSIAAMRQFGKEGLRYNAERSGGGRVDLGVCEVTIPKTHTVGALESPSILRLEVREDAARHVVLRKTERLADERFYELLRQRVAGSPRRELFVFVHGFNVSFEDAARRTAQIHYDLRFEGAPIFFSWPAHDKFVITYPADETNVAWSAPHLKHFLLEIVQQSQARSVNLIAHSMGNRALAAALREIELEMRDQARLFNQVVLAAPDIDADDFRHNIAPAMQRTAHRLTLYASSRDDALLASRLVHRGPRAGDAGQGLVIIPGIDTIDVTAIDSSPWGHNYYGSSDPVLQDLKALLLQAAQPHQRSWLSPAERDGLTYWIFQAARTASSETGLPR
jgi:esterase/lipase superfamily enzyme